MKLRLPHKNSTVWIFIMAALFLLTLTAMIFTGIFLEMEIGFDNISGFVLLSALVAVSIGGGGYIGAKIYFCIALLFDLFGVVYLLTQSKIQGGNGENLSVLVSYLFILAAGVVLGIAVQAIVDRRNRKKGL